ncbi:hypothetical protein PZA11_002456 [Diplocarpon coronariae]
MRLLSVFTAIIAASVIALAVPEQETTSLDPLLCTSLGENCVFKFDVATQLFRCTCNNSNNLRDLIWLYTSKNFGGFEYQAYGNYKTCQNLPNYWDRNTHSLKCNVNPSVICCIYTDKNCNTVGHDATTVATEVAELIGYYEGTRSFMCNERIDESSTCDGAPVQGHI